MLASIDLFNALKTKFGEAEATVIVKEIEKIEASVEIKVEKAFERKKDVLATKEDIARLENKIIENKVDILKRMVGCFIGIALAILGLYFKN